MTINKIVVKNYKLLQDVVIPLNPEINIFVGDNDSGKSTILEVLCILTTGKLNGYAFERQLKANMFTNSVRKDFIQKISSGEKKAPPEIVFEAYFDGDPIYRGSNNTLSEQDAIGINITVRIAEKNIELYKHMVKNGDVKDIPIELYTVDYHYFSGDPFAFRYGPFKSVFIDTSHKDYIGLVDHFISESISDTLTEDQIRDLSIAYGSSRRSFHENETVKQLNDAVRHKAVVKGRDISLDLREDDPQAWKRQMSIVVDSIPFEQVGFGTQNTIKIELALRNAEEQANVVLIEEPENNLSFSNMTVLVNHITQSSGKQVFISTHSSYIANKLSLSNIILVRSGMTSPYCTLSDDTKKYFIKLPGYDTLRFILSSRVILVEGPTDDLIIQRAYLEKHSRLPSEDGIDIIVVDSLAFKRYLDIALLIRKPVVIVTDNDGDISKHILAKYQDYQQDFFTYYYETNETLHTIEPSVLAVNLDEHGEPTETFKRAISSRGSMMNRDKDCVLSFMSASENKSEWAYRVFESAEKINYPEYINNVVKHYE